MKRYAFISFLLIGLNAVVGRITSQQSIIISDSLIANADVLEVDAEYLAGNNRKFTLGEYSVYADETLGGTYYDTKERLTGLRVVTDRVKTFSFDIKDSTNTAEVYAEEKIRTNTYYPNAVLENFILEESSSTKFKSFAAWINIKGDSSTTWTLYVPKARGKERKFHFEMLLSDGVKFIKVDPVSSDIHFDYDHPLRSLLRMPAMGVEFTDAGKSICAVQYDAGAANNFDMGENQSFGCKTWMHRDLDAKTRLVMASAMATVMLMNNPYLSVKE